MNKLNEIINNRVVAILCHGASIKYLEDYIERFKYKDICWMATGVFTIFEEFILSKINEQLDIVFDCATVPEPNIPHYESIRLTRLDKFLSREENNLWITTHGMFRDAIIPYRKDFLDLFKEKIIQVDKLFPQNNVPHWMDVPNSTTLAIASAMAGKARKIILFGVDGCTITNNNVCTYYKPEIQKQERIDGYGDVLNEGLIRDTIGFEERFPKIYSEYIELFGNVPIINCSTFSHYTCIPRIAYEELENELNAK